MLADAKAGIPTWVHSRHDILPKISGLCEWHIFVVRKSYKTQKAQDLVGLVLFNTISCVLRAWRNIWIQELHFGLFFEKWELHSYLLKSFIFSYCNSDWFFRKYVIISNCRMCYNRYFDWCCDQELYREKEQRNYGFENR